MRQIFEWTVVETNKWTNRGCETDSIRSRQRLGRSLVSRFQDLCPCAHSLTLGSEPCLNCTSAITHFESMGPAWWRSLPLWLSHSPSHEKRKKILCDGRCAVPPGYPPLQETKTCYCGNWHCYGQTAVICWNLSGFSWIISFIQGYATFPRQWHSRIDQVRRIKPWLSYSGQLWMVMSSSEVPLQFAKVPTYAARLPLQLDFSLFLINLASFSSFHSCCSQVSSLINPIHTGWVCFPPDPAWSRIGKSMGCEWRQLTHTSRNAASHFISESTFSYSLIYMLDQIMSTFQWSKKLQNITFCTMSRTNS